MSLVKRNIIFPKGTTDGFQLIPQPARAPLGGVAYAEKDDDVVPYDQMVQYFIDNMGGGGTGTVTSVSRTLGSTGTDVSLTITNPTTTPNIDLQLPTASATNRGLLSAADWLTFSLQIKRLVEITKTTAESMQSGTSAVPGQWYRVTEAALAPIVASKLASVILVGGIDGKFSIQAWAELITTKGNFYTPCSFGPDFRLDRPHGTADLWRGRLSQSGTDAPSIDNTSLNNLDELPTFSYDGTGEYTLTVTGDQFKANDIFIPIFQIVKLKSGDVIKYVSIEFSDSSNLFIKTYYFDSTTNSAVLSDDILNKTTIRLQRVISNEV